MTKNQAGFVNGNGTKIKLARMAGYRNLSAIFGWLLFMAYVVSMTNPHQVVDLGPFAFATGGTVAACIGARGLNKWAENRSGKPE